MSGPNRRDDTDGDGLSAACVAARALLHARLDDESRGSESGALAPRPDGEDRGSESGALAPRLDDDRAGAAPEVFERHLATCADCRELAADLAALSDGLRQLPPLQLPGDALQAIFGRTVDAPRTRPRVCATAAARFVRPRRLAATAAATILAALLLVAVNSRPGLFRGSPGERYTPAEIARAGRGVRLALGITETAIRRSQSVAMNQALGRGVTPALARLPFLRACAHASATRRN
jgi:hypothetical protein